MSASNWKECPKCKQNAEHDHANKVQAWRNQYGKVPIEEFEATKPSNELAVMEDSMREDYEFFLDENLVLHIDYRARCQNCDFEFTYSKAVDASND